MTGGQQKSELVTLESGQLQKPDVAVDQAGDAEGAKGQDPKMRGELWK